MRQGLRAVAVVAMMAGLLGSAAGANAGTAAHARPLAATTGDKDYCSNPDAVVGQADAVAAVTCQTG